MGRGSIPGVRVRFDAKGRALLSAEDLRSSGVEDLKRLAESDRSKSTALVSRGNDDGWVSLPEVEKAVGLHNSIVGGYYAVLDAAKRDRPASLPLADVLSLMKAGGSGPIRHRKPPRTKKLAPDVVLNPKKYDAKHAGANPRFLGRHLEAIESALGAETKARPVYRGFTLPDYGGPELVRYLHGDWRCVIASHTFTETLRGQLEKGTELHRAIEKTADQIAARVIREITKDGYQAYAAAESCATQIGVANKKATGMASYVDSPLESAQLTPTAFGYATTGYLGVISKRILEPTHPMIVVEVEQKLPKGYEGPEFYIPSHVAPDRILRAFLGFSNWYDVQTYLSPPAEKQEWFELGIVARDAEGRPTEITLSPAKPKRNGYTERWHVGDVAWRSSEADSPQAKAFLEQHPELRPTVAQILGCKSG